MNSLWFGLTLISFFLLPGFLFLRFFSKEVTFLGSFFAGLSLYYLLSIGINVFTNELRILKIVLPIFYLIFFIVSAYYIKIIKRKSLIKGSIKFIPDFLWKDSNLNASLKVSDVTYYTSWVLIFFLLVGYRLTHNFHYDDTVHLSYISAYLKEGNIFPHLSDYSKAVFKWGDKVFYTNIYGFFANLYMLPGLFFKTDFVYDYYLWGFFLFFILLLLLDQFVSRFISDGKLIRLLFILTFILWHHDNPLNYGGYPLSAAKTFFYAGILYLLGYIKDGSIRDLVISVGIINLAWIFHMNMAVPFIAFTPFLILTFFIGYMDKREEIRRYSASLFAYSSLVIVLLLFGKNFIYYAP